LEEEFGGGSCVRPLSLIFDDELDESSEKHILPFNIESIDVEERKDELINIGRYPSFQGCQSEDEGLDAKLGSPDISFQL